MAPEQSLPDLVPEGLKPLHQLEGKIITALPLGQTASNFKPEDVIDLANLADEQIVRSEFLSWLLNSPEAAKKVHNKGLSLRGARITDPLDLADSHWGFPLRWINCSILENISLDRGTFALLDFSGCQTGPLSACSVQVQFDILLKEGFKAVGGVNLSEANIGGDLDCSTAELIAPDDFALNAANATIKGNVYLTPGFMATGEVCLMGANISGNLDAGGARLDNPSGYTLNLANSTIRGNVNLADKFRSKGFATLISADIGGDLNCQGGHFENPLGFSLAADGFTTGGEVYISKGFMAKGVVSFSGASLGGDLVCTGGRFNTPQGYALNAAISTIKGNVFLNTGFNSTGEVCLMGASIAGTLDASAAELDNPKEQDDYTLNAANSTIRGNLNLSDNFKSSGTLNIISADIGGDLNCKAGQFENPQGYALSADGISVKGEVYFSDKFKARGTVSFAGANLSSDLVCTAGEFENLTGDALNAANTTIKGNAFLNTGFKSRGEVDLVSASIDGILDCGGGEFTNPNGDALNAANLTSQSDVYLRFGFKAVGNVNFFGASIGKNLECRLGVFMNPGGYALTADNMKVAGSFNWRELNGAPRGIISLTNANVAVLDDDESDWPEPGNLNIDGFVYGPLTAPQVPADAKARLRWLALRDANANSVQPYTQLISVFKEMGLTDDAQNVAIARQRAMRKQQKGLSRFWSWILDTTISYGYHPSRVILMFILPIILLGSLVFAWAFSLGAMQATGSQAQLAPKDQRFDALAYSVDVFLPIVDLHQESAWTPNAAAKDGLFFEYYLYFHILSGWFFTTLAVAAITGLVRTD
ncbi:MAG: hypothetical protein P4L50_26890 [Anaerolineaceae bacterium]|nr:hypothetical protein [Anaerolineaceae bacterium]